MNAVIKSAIGVFIFFVATLIFILIPTEAIAANTATIYCYPGVIYGASICKQGESNVMFNDNKCVICYSSPTSVACEENGVQLGTCEAFCGINSDCQERSYDSKNNKKCLICSPKPTTPTPTPTQSRGSCEVPGSNRWSCMQQTECNSNGGTRYYGNNNVCTTGICCDLGPQVATPTTTTPPIDNPSGNNSCVSYDPGYNNRDNVFSCSNPGETCESKGLTTYDRTSYNKCSNGGTCCYNKAVYDNRDNVKKLGSGGPGANPPPDGGTTPETGTKAPSKPETYPCESYGGQKQYLGAFCGDADGLNPQPFNPTKAAAKVFCGLTYIDMYLCGDDKPHNYPNPSIKTCAQSPWCPSTSTTSPTPSDAPNCQTQGITCGPAIPCCGSKNLVCDKKSSTCQYNSDPSKGPVGAFTPTPGASSNCTPGFKGTGCACDSEPSKCGCATTHNPEPSIDNPSAYFCVPFPVYKRWCTKTQTLLPATGPVTACTGADAYATPTPTPKDLSYQADCPANNWVTGAPNACVLGSICPEGYKQQTDAGNPGKTNGNQVCTEFEGGRTSVCCTKTSAYTTPAISSAPTPIPTTIVTDAPGCPSDGTNVCKPNACSSYGLQQNTGAGANDACRNINPVTNQPYGQYCCK